MDGEPMIGQSIREYDTMNATITQLNGEFELSIPAHKTVLLELSQCFENGYVIVYPDLDFIVIEMNQKFRRKSKRVWKKWKRNSKAQP